MLKSTIIASAVLFGAAAPLAVPAETSAETFAETSSETAHGLADQTALEMLEVDSVVAQFAYLEINHDDTGFGLAVAKDTAVFVNVKCLGNLNVRIGF